MHWVVLRRPSERAAVTGQLDLLKFLEVHDIIPVN
jgi:hypothetical protein